jgi:hypothetical protein
LLLIQRFILFSALFPFFLVFSFRAPTFFVFCKECKSLEETRYLINHLPLLLLFLIFFFFFLLFFFSYRISLYRVILTRLIKLTTLITSLWLLRSHIGHTYIDKQQRKLGKVLSCLGVLLFWCRHVIISESECQVVSRSLC